jgi:hypothetical protein
VMAPLIEQGKVRVLETSRGVSIEINDSILFSPGQALLQPPTGQSHAVGRRSAGRRGFSDHHRGAHRQYPDQEHAVPFELGTFRRACDHRPAPVRRCRRRGRAPDRDWLCRYASGRAECAGGRAGAQSPGDDPDRIGHSRKGHREDHAVPASLSSGWSANQAVTPERSAARPSAASHVPRCAARPASCAASAFFSPTSASSSLTSPFMSICCSVRATPRKLARRRFRPRLSAGTPPRSHQVSTDRLATGKTGFD